MSLNMEMFWLSNSLSCYLHYCSNIGKTERKKNLELVWNKDDRRNDVWNYRDTLKYSVFCSYTHLMFDTLQLELLECSTINSDQETLIFFLIRGKLFFCSQKWYRMPCEVAGDAHFTDLFSPRRCRFEYLFFWKGWKWQRAVFSEIIYGVSILRNNLSYH